MRTQEQRPTWGHWMAEVGTVPSWQEHQRCAPDGTAARRTSRPSCKCAPRKPSDEAESALKRRPASRQGSASARPRVPAGGALCTRRLPGGGPAHAAPGADRDPSRRYNAGTPRADPRPWPPPQVREAGRGWRSETHCLMIPAAASAGVPPMPAQALCVRAPGRRSSVRSTRRGGHPAGEGEVARCKAPRSTSGGRSAWRRSRQAMVICCAGKGKVGKSTGDHLARLSPRCAMMWHRRRASGFGRTGATGAGVRCEARRMASS